MKIVRNMDCLGRIVLPREYRNTLGWTEDTKITVTKQNNKLILQTYRGYCFRCGSEQNVQSAHGKFICKKCFDRLSTKNQ